MSSSLAVCAKLTVVVHFHIKIMKQRSH
uniref:Uncharacterized protein n=1 Tax=Lepeophtheirus salmonis TaxID=72036 RepID=A0A0K2UBI7_LEPSM